MTTVSFLNCKTWDVSWKRKTAAYDDEPYPNSAIVRSDSSSEAINEAKRQFNIEEGKYFFRVWPSAEEATVKKGQIELPLQHPKFQPYLGNFKRIRKALASGKNMLTSWKQLPLKLHLRKLYKIAKIGFVWTRPDGRQFKCRNVRALVARIMDYDGHELKGVLRLI